jgi:hypothetical protein
MDLSTIQLYASIGSLFPLRLLCGSSFPLRLLRLISFSFSLLCQYRRINIIKRLYKSTSRIRRRTYAVCKGSSTMIALRKGGRSSCSISSTCRDVSTLGVDSEKSHIGICIKTFFLRGGLSAISVYKIHKYT